MTSEVLEHGALRARFQKDHDVSSHDDSVKATAEPDGRQIGELPVDVRGCTLRRTEHLGVDVDADDLYAAAGQLASDAAGAATGIERGGGGEAHDESGLAVDVLASGGATLVGGVVVVAGGGAFAEPAVRFVGHNVDDTMPRDST